MKTRISPKLKWLNPYLEIGISLIPKKHKISRIGAWTTGKSRGKDIAAAIFQTRIGEPHRIWLHTHFNQKTPYSKIDILKHFAHELAHTVDWKHTPKHSKLEAKITSAFMDQLKKEDYISEEEELK